MPTWTTQEVEKLKEIYNTVSNEVLEKTFARKIHLIQNKAKKVGLRLLTLYDTLDKEYVLKRAAEGATAQKVSEEVGCWHGLIARVYRENGFNIRIKKHDLPVEEIIRRYTVEKHPPKVIAKDYNCSFSAVRRLLLKHNVEQNTERDYNGKLESEDIFEVVDTEQKAYLLGLIAADGSLRKKAKDRTSYCLSLKLVDEEMVREAAKWLGWKGAICCRPGGKQNILGKICNRKPAWYFTINSTKMVEDIDKIGIPVSKSKYMDFPNIPLELRHHFIRGFFDGDGSISWQSSRARPNKKLHFSIIGLESILTPIQNILIEECKVAKTKLTLSKRVSFPLYNLNYNASADTVAIRDYLYKDATLFLQRKYDTFFLSNESTSGEGQPT